MSFRAKIILYILVALALLLSIYFVLRGRAERPEEAATPPTPEAAAPGALPLAVQPPAFAGPVTIPPEQMAAYKSQESIKVAAKNFAERFGSYSVIANFSNFDELRDAVTESTWDWLKTYRLEVPKKTDANFVGVTTRVLSTRITAQSEDKATVLVSTQREETLSTGPRVSYRDMRVELILKDKQWLVDGAYWQ